MSGTKLRIHDGVHYIKVKGSNAERARQHIELVKDSALKGAIPALADRNEVSIRRASLKPDWEWFRRLLAQGYRSVLCRWLHSRLNAEEKEIVRAMASAVGLPPNDARQALFQADGMMILSSYSPLGQHLLGDLPAALPGCTSAVALRNWTESGRLLVARNLDYPAVGAFDVQPAVIFHEPTDSNHIPHVCVTSVGVHTSGLTSMNREGLTLAVHAHLGKKVSLWGRPIFFIGDEVIRSAKTLGQAVDLIRKSKRIGNWSFVISSAKEGTAAVVEMSADSTQVVPVEDGLLTHSNYFRTRDFQEKEILLSGSWTEDVISRRLRMRQLLEPHRGVLQPFHMLNALADQTDWHTGEERVLGNTISVVTTVSSVVMDPDRQVLWVSARGESPVGWGPFAEINVPQFWKLDESLPPPLLSGTHPHSSRLQNSIRHYREAYKAWQMADASTPLDVCGQHALAEIEKAIAHYPHDGNLDLQAGILSFKLGNFSVARTFFESSLLKIVGDHTQAIARLFLGRFHDIQGNRPGAVHQYMEGLSVAHDPKITEALKRGLKKTYLPREARHIMIDLQFPDCLRY